MAKFANHLTDLAVLNIMKLRTTLTFIAICLGIAAYAQDAPTDSTAPDPQKSGNIIKRIINYFDKTNKTYGTKPFDVSFIGGPYYSSDSKFGIGLVAAGLYNLDPADSAWTRPSHADLLFKATTAAHFQLSLRGENIFPADRSRISYDISFYAIKTKFWGIGYDQCSNDDNETGYRYLAFDANVAYYWHPAGNFYAGPMIVVDYIVARSFNNPQRWVGLPHHTFNWGPGVSLRYDTRDNPTAAHRGVSLRLDQWFSPRGLGNNTPFSANEFTADWYHEMWRGSVLAVQGHWRLTWGDTPWGALSTIGGSSNMRGYFEGRYRDKNVIDLCVELRQHVWRRSGVVAWVGAASLFPKFSQIHFRQILPNCGVGYRWEFKKNTNVRVDLGFGRHEKGFMFNINEAF